MAGPVRVRRLTDQEGQKLQRIVRRGSTGTVRYRRAMMIPASSGGNTIQAIANLVAADEDTVRDVSHAFNDQGPGCLASKRAGGCPRHLRPDEETLLVPTATTRPAKLGRPFTRWSPRTLAAHLAQAPGLHIGREAVRPLLKDRGVTFQRTRTRKESPAPEREAELKRIEHVTTRFPDRVFAFDAFGPSGIRPTAETGWAPSGHPVRPVATYRRTHAITYVHGRHPVGTDTL